jgi:hypothetical protein
VSHAERADIYSYFLERGLKLLNPAGRLGMIVSNKFLRANYGKPLRGYLAQNGAVECVVDFAGLPVFKGATVRTVVMLASRKAVPGGITQYSPPLPMEVFSSVATGSVTLEQAVADTTYQVPLSEGGWTFVRQNTGDLLAKLKTVSQQLREYCEGQIYMGIKSGLTEAFVIDAATRTNILAQNPAAEEIIKPFLNGRDVRRYQDPTSEQFLIYTYHGVEISKYPAVEQHLRRFKAQLEKRATKQEWYELQQPQRRFAPYMDGPKIVFPDIATAPRFTLDEAGHYGSNTVYFIPRSDLYLLGLLNSRLGYFYFRATCAG